MTTNQSSISNLQSPISVDPTLALGLIKPSVRAESAYALEAPAAARKLNQNESPTDLPPEIKQAILTRAAAVAWHRYPDFVPHSLARLIAQRHGWTEEGVLVGNGSNELIQATLAVTLGPGAAIVAPRPTFALYRLLAGIMGARYVPVPLSAEFGYDVDSLVLAAQRESARVIVINSPNNPTGSILPVGGVERLLAQTDALVVCDEAYQDFGGDSALGLLHDSARLVVLRTFSKAMAMAGLRCGYALAHPSIAREIAKAKLPYNVNAITLAAAEVALEHSEVLATRTRTVIAERERLFERLRELPGIRVFPSAANFILFRCERLSANVVFHRLIDGYGILVRDVSGGAGLAECLRVSVGTREDCDAVVGGLREILEGSEQ